MKKDSKFWKIDELRNKFVTIDFPEYQRESNIWSLADKRRLIDSILRRFDIASLYFYRNETELICIDGRQRINAIMSFLDANPEDPSNNGFRLRVSNEIEDDEGNWFKELDGFTWKEIKTASEKGKATATAAHDQILGYELTVVLLSEATKPSEFNLQFTRLNLGTLINAGERLHAMVGEMRDLCFNSDKLGKHSFFRYTAHSYSKICERASCRSGDRPSVLHERRRGFFPYTTPRPSAILQMQCRDSRKITSVD